MKEINLLLPKVQQMASEFIDKCQRENIQVIITSTYRSNEEQDALYAQGRTTDGNVVTNAKGGQSMHNYKVALDFCPTVNGVADWGNKDMFTKIGMIGESCGFEWGGRWVSFLDMPHLQYTTGYTLADFQNSTVDYSKFEVTIPKIETPVQPIIEVPVVQVPVVKKTTPKEELISMVHTFVPIFGVALMSNISTLDFTHISKDTLIAVGIAVLRSITKTLWNVYFPPKA